MCLPFDPLGLISLIILEGRLVLQMLCRDGLSWDDKMPEELMDRWRKWVEDLQDHGEINIPRSYRNSICDLETVEMHNFSDASLTAYRVCSYLRLTDTEGNTSKTLVMAKSHVNPSNPVTVPRLELTGAVLAVKIASFLGKQTEKVVLVYMNNVSKQFHLFVTNRSLRIRAASEPSQWHYVPTKANPADLASRGATVAELKKSAIWQGPQLLEHFNIFNRKHRRR